MTNCEVLQDQVVQGFLFLVVSVIITAMLLMLIDLVAKKIPEFSKEIKITSHVFRFGVTPVLFVIALQLNLFSFKKEVDGVAYFKNKEVKPCHETKVATSKKNKQYLCSL